MKLWVEVEKRKVLAGDKETLLYFSCTAEQGCGLPWEVVLVQSLKVSKS